jgi:hypothetical protein
MPRQGQTIDVRFEPAYQLSEAARYIHVPKQTVWNWFRGLNDNPVLDLASSDHHAYVSFMGLAEAHVLSSMRKHGVPLQRIRCALHHLKLHFKSEHPLVELEVQTDGLDLFRRRGRFSHKCFAIWSDRHARRFETLSQPH